MRLIFDVGFECQAGRGCAYRREYRLSGEGYVKTIIVIGYLVIGVIVAAAKDYLGDVGSLGDIVNLLLAIVLWPLVLLGVDFNLKIGGDDGGNGKDNGGDKKNGALLMVGPVIVYARSAITRVVRRISPTQ
jgi:hypothetical protein